LTQALMLMQALMPQYLTQAASAAVRPPTRRRRYKEIRRGGGSTQPQKLRRSRKLHSCPAYSPCAIISSFTARLHLLQILAFGSPTIGLVRETWRAGLGAQVLARKSWRRIAKMLEEFISALASSVVAWRVAGQL